MRNSRSQYYPDPYPLPGAVLAHKIIKVTETELPFWLENAKELLITLGIHKFLQTALTGTQNDLDIIARVPGSSPAIAIELRDPSAASQTLDVAVHSFLTTALTGANNDFTFTAVPEGSTLGDAITIALVDPAGNDAALGIVVTGSAIVVNLATGSGGAITSTAADIITAINADNAAKLLVKAANAAGSSGAGVVTALTATHLAGTSIVATLATNSGSAITTTAAQLRAAINADTLASPLVVANLQASNDGTGVVTALAHTLLGVVTGTSPTCDLQVETSIDETSLTSPVGNYWQAGALTQVTAVGHTGKMIEGLGIAARFKPVIGGTTPVFAVSISSIFRP